MSGLCVDCGVPVTGARCRSCHIARVNGPRRTFTCRRCGASFTRKLKKPGEVPTYCGFDCYNIDRGAAPSCPVRFRQCRWCGGWFRQVRGAYCSSKCRLDASLGRPAERVNALYRLTIERGYNGKAWRKNLREALRERDGGDCCICWRPIDFAVMSGPRGSDQGYSFEHLIPWSVSKDDSWRNLGLSHWGCNRDRQTQPLDVLWRAV